ncbi:MAG TPA: hypothetical protein VFU72_15945 [Nitrolancea sp.]|nr:hypothetical protein [Nitrolancea sp.]
MTLDEATATRIVEEAVEEAGGRRRIHGSPRHPFALNPTREVEIEGHTVVIRYGEASSPAIAELEGYIFDIRPEGLILLFGP